jgi:predicted component of type VI protein secretion system
MNIQERSELSCQRRRASEEIQCIRVVNRHHQIRQQEVQSLGLEERRFFVLDISDKHMQDHEYFGRLVSQMNNGGREGMLHDLLQYDFSGIDLRRFPRTEALMDQVVNSMSPVEKFWYDRLRS